MVCECVDMSEMCAGVRALLGACRAYGWLNLVVEGGLCLRVSAFVGR